MKSARIAIMLLSVLLLLSACGSSSSRDIDVLEGYWMDDRGNTVTFTGDGAVMWYGNSFSYTIYDEDKVLIKNGDVEIGNYKFEVKSEKLEMTDLGLNAVTTLYGKESKQQEILEEIREEEETVLEVIAKEEKEFLDACVAAEYAAEIEMLMEYQNFCKQEATLTTNPEDVEFFNAEVGYVQERLDILNKGNLERIAEDSFLMAESMICHYILPEDVAESENTIFMDNGLQYIDNTDGGQAFVGYMVDVRIDNGSTAPLYGSYAVCHSTRDIYAYNVVDGIWEYQISLPLI